MSIEERLVSLRKERGLSQLDVAEALNVSRQAVSKWESGAALPSIDNLWTISRLYNVTVDWLVSGEAGPEVTNAPQESVAPQIPNVPREPEESPAPEVSKKTRSKIVKPVLCLICLLAAVIVALAAAPASPGPQGEPEIVEFEDLICENWQTAQVREFRMG